MLTILVNNNQLVLPDDIEIRVEFNAPYLDTEGIPADVVWHFDVPIAGNESTFKYVNLLHVRIKKHEFNAVIRLHGYPIGRGTMKITSYTADSYRVMITMRSFGVVFKDQKLNQGNYTPLRIGGSPHLQANVIAHVEGVNNETIEADYRFPCVYAPKFYGDNNDTDLPEYNTTYGHFVNMYREAIVVTNTNDYNPQSFVPMPLLFPAIKKALAVHNYTLTGSVPEHSELKKLLALSRVSLDHLDYDGYAKVFLTNKYLILDPGIAHVPFVNETYTDATDVHNCMSNGYYTALNAGTYEIYAELNSYILNPYPRFFDVILYIYVNDVCVYQVKPHYRIYWSSRKIRSFDGDEIEVECISRYTSWIKGFIKLQANDVVDIRFSTYNSSNQKFYTSYIIDKEMIGDHGNDYTEELRQNYCRITNRTANNANDHKNSIKLGDHIPVVATTTVLNTIRNLFFATLFFDDDKKTVEMSFLDDVLNSTGSIDITRNLIVNQNEGEIEQTLLPVLSYTHIEKVSDIASNKLLTDETLPLDFDLATQRYDAYFFYPALNSVYEFKIEEKTLEYYGHNFQPYGDSDDDESTSVSLEVGVVPMVQVQDKVYPYTSVLGVSNIIPNEEDEPGLQLLFWRGMMNYRPVATSTTMIEGAKTTGELSLDLNATNGPVNTFGKGWLQFLKDYEIVTEKLTNVDIWLMLDLISLLKPNNSKRWLTINSVKCLPHQMTFIMQLNGNIKECEIKAIKSNSI